MNVIVGLLILVFPFLLFVYLSAKRYNELHPSKYCRVYLKPDGKVDCIKDNMHQSPEVCKICNFFVAYQDGYVLCSYHERLGGWKE